jgi:hypothetical protein
MASESAIDSALAAIMTQLNVSSFTTLTPGGVSEVPPTGSPYPAAWVTAKESGSHTFGRQTQKVDVQVHLYCDKPNQDDVWPALKEAVKLLDRTTPSLSGWTSHLFLYDHSYRLPDETISSTVCAHVVGSFMLTAEKNP